MAWDEWEQIKAEVSERRAGQLQLNSGPANAGGMPGELPAAADLGLIRAPIATKASGMQLMRQDSQGDTKLDDAASAGKAHAGWEAGAENGTCVASWQRRLHELGDVADAAADALTKAMDVQISGDQSVKDRIQAAADSLEGS